MAQWSVGSVAHFTGQFVDDIPSGISGTVLTELAQQQINFVEQYTGATIGNTSIDPKYQPVLLKLTMAELLNILSIQGLDVSNISLGDLSIGKGQGGATDSASAKLKEQALFELKQSLGRRVRYYKAFDS